jgi:hypothetical protein
MHFLLKKKSKKRNNALLTLLYYFLLLISCKYTGHNNNEKRWVIVNDTISGYYKLSDSVYFSNKAVINNEINFDIINQKNTLTRCIEFNKELLNIEDSISQVYISKPIISSDRYSLHQILIYRNKVCSNRFIIYNKKRKKITNYYIVNSVLFENENSINNIDTYSFINKIRRVFKLELNKEMINRIYVCVKYNEAEILRYW